MKEEKIFKCLGRKHSVEVLSVIMLYEGMSFKTLCEKLPFSAFTVRLITNSLSRNKLVSVKKNNKLDNRSRGYYITELGKKILDMAVCL